MSEATNVKSIFGRAIAIGSDDQRRAFLEQECQGQPELRAQVDELLSSFDQASRFMTSPAVDPPATVDIPKAAREKSGDFIGPYKLLQQIGEGGMGTVYMAEQTQPVSRKVALKVIKPGMDSDQVIARFEAERQALAMMDHQNIARVLDAGVTGSGRPFFVMELVRGDPITEFCDKHRLSPRQRLDLFLPVCHAIQHAHQKGIIHRDIKPSNILVTHYDGVPVPKVIDFGIAKATQQRLTEKTLFTQFGQVIGTLEYMSPEQAELSHLDVDTRSDVYSLGVLLYELLTGSTPLDGKTLRELAFEEMLKQIREFEPPRPSVRLSSTADAMPSISVKRSTDPRRLSSLMKGELDWIVLKTLEKDRTRRYDSASGLAADIQRYLHHEAVEACPPSTVYRLRKFGQKHRSLLATAASLLLLLLLGVAVTSWQAVRAARASRLAMAERQRAVAAKVEADKERDRAVAAEQLAESRLTEVQTQRDKAMHAQQQAETASQYLVDVFRSPDPEKDGREVKVFEVLDRASEQLQETFDDAPEIKAKLLRALGDTYEGLALPNEAVKVLEQAHAIHEKHSDPSSRNYIATQSQLGELQQDAGQLKLALETQQAAYDAAVEHYGAADEVTVDAMARLAMVKHALGARLEALKLRERVLELRTHLYGENDERTVSSMYELFTSLARIGSWERAQQLIERCVTLGRRVHGPEHRQVYVYEIAQGLAGYRNGDSDKAVTVIDNVLVRSRERLGEGNTISLGATSLVAEFTLDPTYSRYDAIEGMKLAQDTLTLQRKHLGTDHPATLHLMGGYRRTL